MKIILVDAVHTFVDKNGSIDEKLYSLLEKFDNNKIILTNASRAKFSQFGLDKAPYPVFTLEKNPTKLDSIYFETLLNENDLSPNDVIYFEHNSDAVNSAQGVGIISHHFDPEKRDLNLLEDFLNNNI